MRPGTGRQSKDTVLLEVARLRSGTIIAVGSSIFWFDLKSGVNHSQHSRQSLLSPSVFTCTTKQKAAPATHDMTSRVFEGLCRGIFFHHALSCMLRLF
jgi:hypothetical protein